MESAKLPVELPIGARTRSLIAPTSWELRIIKMTHFTHPVRILAHQQQARDFKGGRKGRQKQMETHIHRKATSNQHGETKMDEEAKKMQSDNSGCTASEESNQELTRIN